MSLILLPCPFCGGKAELVQPMNRYKPEPVRWVKCSSCDAATAMDGDVYMAAALWNARASMAETIKSMSETST